MSTILRKLNHERDGEAKAEKEDFVAAQINKSRRVKILLCTLGTANVFARLRHSAKLYAKIYYCNHKQINRDTLTKFYRRIPTLWLVKIN